MTGDGVVLETRAVSKTFGAVRALQSVSFALRAGEVHGLAGENGAGKSTLIKVLTGFHQPDSGEILLAGQPVRFADPRASQRAGVRAVYQEINLIPERSVAENMFLGDEPRRFGLLIDRRRMAEQAREILGRYGLDIDPRARLASLGLGLQQMVSIARAVSRGARVVIMDEPSSALTGHEVETLFALVDRLREERIAILFVSHRLSECYRLCDRLTVLRDGKIAASGTVRELPRAELVAAMLGRSAEILERGHGQAPAAAAGPVLKAEDISWRNRVRGVTLSVRAGEVVGLAGLLGAGRTETMKAVFGAERPDSGRVILGGRAMGEPSPARSIRRGLGFLPEDRRSEGIFPKLSVRENLTAAILPRIARFGFISKRRQDALVARFTAELGIKTDGPGAPITSLSGGNQQKVLIARCLAAEPLALMLDDPTRGIDVGAKAEVHAVIHRQAGKGLAVLATSSELEELMALSHRLVVLSEGAVAGERDTAETAPGEVLDLLAGAP
ncbi:MAG TPA: sugar ABC transporter ATP-binding protein [Acetobacteraceae bacterium]|nr:sugar ABC transporter ATP-binding protein [Acetobacteraceae bacterium]